MKRGKRMKKVMCFLILVAQITIVQVTSTNAQTATASYNFGFSTFTGGFQIDTSTKTELSGALDQFTAYQATSFNVTYDDTFVTYSWVLSDFVIPAVGFE